MKKSFPKLSLFSILMLGCGLAFTQVHYREIPMDALPGWNQDHQSQAITAMQTSCQTNIKRRALFSRFDARASNAWQQACQALLRLPPHSSDVYVRQVLEHYFNAYEIETDPHQTGLFTGYYEPTLQGSLIPTDYYNVPIYGLPRGYGKRVIDGRWQQVFDDQGVMRPIPSRAIISDGPALPDTPVLAWVHSKIERFFLDIQGSGEVDLSNGNRMLVGYAGQNGQPYYPIGRYLVQIGALTPHNISLQTIQEWLQSNPDQADRVMNLNPAFVFFRVLQEQNPIGAEGVPLSPSRSIAIDPDYYRYSTLFWISTSWPDVHDGEITPGKPLNRLMVAQDTGGAIEGPIRADIFWGSGERAKWLAGHMQFPGQMWILWPKGIWP